MKDSELQSKIEDLLDASDIDAIFRALVETCYLKAEHLETNWQDKVQARGWIKLAKFIDKCADKLNNLTL